MTAQVDRRRPAAPALQFVVISDPKQTRTADARKLVRTQAARSSRAAAGSSSQCKGATTATAGARKRRQAKKRLTPPGHRSSSEDAATASSSEDSSALMPMSASPHEAAMWAISRAPALLTALTASKADPFNCSARIITRQEQWLIDHYVKVSLPCIATSGAKSCFSPAERYRHNLLTVTEWIPTGFASPGVMAGVLLAIVRRLAREKREARGGGVAAETADPELERLALRYRGECLRLTGEAVAHPATATADATILMVLSLMYDCGTIGDRDGFLTHATATMRIAELRGGPQHFGCNGIIALTLRLFWDAAQPSCLPPPKPGAVEDDVALQELKRLRRRLFYSLDQEK